MATEIIKIRKKNNHSVIRDIKVSSIKSFTKFGWEIVPNTEGIQVTAKKKDVEGAESKSLIKDPSAFNPGLPVSFSAPDFTGEITETTAAHTANVQFEAIDTYVKDVLEKDALTVEMPEEIPAIESLRDEYETITGKTADKRWSLKRISDELEKLR